MRLFVTLRLVFLKAGHAPLQDEHSVPPVWLATILIAFVGFTIALIVGLLRQTDKASMLSAELGMWKQQTLKCRSKFLNDQTNTHFLFNSLASLSALIAEDRQMAVQFADNLSAVYRYALMVQEKPLITLKEELVFLKSYFDLIHSRFGSSILFSQHIPDDLLNKQLPPLTLQLLVENAVKHNVARTTRPLHITITGETDTLIVENTLQLKAVKTPSTNIGLNNIRERYQQVSSQNILIQHTDAVFRVTVPLI